MCTKLTCITVPRKGGRQRGIGHFFICFGHLLACGAKSKQSFCLHNLSLARWENMIARDMTGFYTTLSARKFSWFVQIWGEGCLHTNFHRQAGEKGTQNLPSGEISKNPAGTAGQHCRFLSLVVVELALIFQRCWPYDLIFLRSKLATTTAQE